MQGEIRASDIHCTIREKRLGRKKLSKVHSELQDLYYLPIKPEIFASNYNFVNFTRATICKIKMHAKVCVYITVHSHFNVHSCNEIPVTM